MRFARASARRTVGAGSAGHPDLAAAGLTALLAVAGTAHLVRPQAFDSLIPRPLGAPRAWVVWSGIAELACAGAVAVPRARRLGALAAAALFVVVLPGNVTMAIDASTGPEAAALRAAVTWARVPLQVPLVAWALAVARRADAARLASRAASSSLPSGHMSTIAATANSTDAHPAPDLR